MISDVSSVRPYPIQVFYSIAARNSYQACFTTQKMTRFGTERNCHATGSDWHKVIENRRCLPLGNGVATRKPRFGAIVAIYAIGF